MKVGDTVHNGAFHFKILALFGRYAWAIRIASFDYAVGKPSRTAIETHDGPLTLLQSDLTVREDA